MKLEVGRWINQQRLRNGRADAAGKHQIFGKHQIYANCQPSISMKVEILQIFCSFSPSHCRWQLFQMGGLLYHMLLQSTHLRWFKVKLGTIQVKSHPDSRDAGGGRVISSDDAHKQTASLGRWCTNRITHHLKFRFMLKINTPVARQWFSHTTKCINLHQIDFYLEAGQHCWIAGGRLILCTYPGDLLLAPSNVLSSQAPAHP